jgi:hypothetical protein
VPVSTDWATIASFATAIGTLVLALATFASIRSANRSARVAEAAFQANMRPVLVTSRLDDPPQKIRWGDDHWARLEGSQATVELVDGNIYMAISVRNVGAGIAVGFGWKVETELIQVPDAVHPDPADFRRQLRDLYTAPGDVGFWHAAIREVSDPDYPALSRDVRDGQPFTIDLLYGDTEGGQRTITRFGMIPFQHGEETRWYPSVGRHWNLDRPDPR